MKRRTRLARNRRIRRFPPPSEEQRVATRMLFDLFMPGEREGGDPLAQWTVTTETLGRCARCGAIKPVAELDDTRVCLDPATCTEPETDQP